MVVDLKMIRTMALGTEDIDSGCFARGQVKFFRDAAANGVFRQLGAVAAGRQGSVEIGVFVGLMRSFQEVCSDG